MKFISEKLYHKLFDWGVILKALMSVGEIILGALLSFFSYETLQRAIYFFTGDEFAETPRDVFWDYVARGFHNFTAAPESFWAFLFISHGIVKLFLAWGLWKEKLWAFPSSAAVFTLFVIYQFYQLTYLNSALLWLITVFDIVLIVLILHEYQHRKRQLKIKAI